MLLMQPCRYIITELLGTDLHRLLTSRRLEKQFIQYFLYQILVRAVYALGLFGCLPFPYLVVYAP